MAAAADDIRDGMRIQWDVKIKMDDGLELSADIFHPVAKGRYPVILSYGPYAKGLAFQEGYPSAWNRMVAEHPDVAAGSTNQYQSWEVVDPEKWVPEGYVCVRVDSRGAGRSPGFTFREQAVDPQAVATRARLMGLAVPDNLPDVLTLSELAELSFAIPHNIRAAEDARKKSKSPSPSSSDATVPAA